MTQHHLHITARDLRDLTRPVLPLAGRDDGFPTIAGIHFRTVDGWLVAEATDRFRMGISRMETSAANFEALVSTANLRRILALFKVTRTENPELDLTADGNRLRVEAAGSLGLLDASVAFELIDGRFPDVSTLVSDALNAEGSADHFGVNPHMLADFRHVPQGAEPIVVRASAPDKPVVIFAGEHFIGLQMPKCSDDSSKHPPESWAKVLKPPKKTAAKKAPAKRKSTKKVA